MKGNKDTTMLLPWGAESSPCCPFNNSSETCTASLYSFLPSAAVRQSFCNTEDYDNCPIFLAKTLREGSGDELCRI